MCEDSEGENIVITGSVQEAVEYLRHTQGNILIATEVRNSISILPSKI